jgi:cellobiose phosphorylase
LQHPPLKRAFERIGTIPVTNSPLSNAFGRFDPSGRRFVVTDSRTPMPWVNVLSNGHYGVVISQNGGGFSWLDNSQLNVLTRWEMDLVRDDHGRFLYLADLESGEVWSGAPAPCQPAYTRYQCEHTQGRTTFSTEYAGIGAEWTLAVAPGDPVECWRVTLTNTTGRTRKLRISSFFEWCCGVAPDAKREFHRLFFTTKHDAGRRAITVRKNMWDTPAKDEREHWNKPWPYVAGHAVGGIVFDADLAMGDKQSFTGRYTARACPEAMTAARPARPGDPNVFGRFGDASAALGGDLTLGPGQSATIVYTLAIASDEKTLLDLLDRHTNVKAADAAIEGAGRMWEELLAPSSVRSEMPDFDLLNSAWLPYQAIAGRLWARTGYYQQSGAFGFRDQLQDSQVWLARDPARTEAQILLHAAHQFADGSVYHWWHPLAEFGLRTACSDDYLWLPFLTAQYIKDTGDWAILDRKAPFMDDAAGASLLEHCTRSIARSLARQSSRGLPLIGSCDWNDGLSAMGVGGRGESVWLAQWLAQLLADFARVVEKGGSAGSNAALGIEYRDQRARLIKAINDHAWDGDSGGQWYRAATRDDGRWIGSAVNEEGRIFLNTQTWAILSETAPAEREDAAWSSVKQHLLQPMGPVLSHPAYTEPDPTIGYITRYAPGLRENGGVYMHAATWALAAACKRRDVRAVESIWRSISPPLRAGNAEAYYAEPYVTPGNVDGPNSSTPGKAGWTWYTGSAAWLNRVSLEWILGMRPEWEGLRIDPCPFASMGRVSATRLWRGRTVRVSFDADEFSANLPPKLTINGREHAGNLVRADDHPSGQELSIDVSWGLHVKPTVGGARAGAAGWHAHQDRRD